MGCLIRRGILLCVNKSEEKLIDLDTGPNLVDMNNL
jgi:hypothetical protein